MVTQVQNRPNNPDYTLSTGMDGRTFILRFRYNSRMVHQVGHSQGAPVYEEGAWLMDVADQDNVPILTGRKLVIGALPLGRTTSQSDDVGRPPGDFLVLDTSGGGFDPGLAELGERVLLMYLDKAETAALV